MAEEQVINPRKDLLDRVALITGAASGIGMAITKRFVQEGAKVALWDFNVARLEQAKEVLSQIAGEEQVFIVPCDITKEEDVIAG
ncbi:MAG: SDR family NAD(P)-dependent oxidoreductase, partial [Candidatus Promineofilum sp.]|nr:SDR family NAD(P)-dependent oxidoreductase [Promineifilum sp.]